MGIELKLENLSLANLCEGLAEEMFQEGLAEVLRVRQAPSAFVQTQGMLVGSVALKIELRMEPDANGAVTAYVQATPKLPARKAVSRGGITMRNGKPMAYVEHKQDALPFRAVGGGQPKEEGGES